MLLQLSNYHCKIKYWRSNSWFKSSETSLIYVSCMSLLSDLTAHLIAFDSLTIRCFSYIFLSPLSSQLPVSVSYTLPITTFLSMSYITSLTTLLSAVPHWLDKMSIRIFLLWKYLSCCRDYDKYSHSMQYIFE